MHTLKKNTLHMIEKALKCLKVQLGLYNVFIAVFLIMMKYGFIDIDHFYIAAFVASSKLNDLSQNASNVVSRVVLPHSCI